MQDRDDHPPGPTRPSLLSAEQQVESDRQLILSRLDAKLAVQHSERTRRTKGGWVASGTVALALCAGAAVWVGSESGKDVVAMIPAPQPAPAPVPVAKQAPAPVPAPEVATAAIVEDPPDELAKSLEPGPPAPASLVPAVPEAVAVKAPHAKPKLVKVGPKPRPAKVAARPPVQKALAAAPAKKAEPIPPDSDEALLAALVAHAKARKPAPVAKPCKPNKQTGVNCKPASIVKAPSAT